MPGYFEFIAAKLQPKSPVKAALLIDLTRSVNGNVRPAGTLLFGLIFGGFALQWAPLPYAAVWTALIIFYPILTTPLRRAIFLAPYRDADAGRFFAKAILLMMPLHVVWASYVPMCWVAGNPTNNAFLVIFLLAGLISTVQIYGPCIYLSLPALIIYAPVISTHYLRTGSVLDPALPMIQLLFCGLLALVALRHFRTFRESVERRITIEALVHQLEAARDTALASNKAKSSFLASMSHELRTPLNAIIGFSDIITQGMLGPIAPAKYGEYVSDIRDSGVRLLLLINNLLDLSKIEAGGRALDEALVSLAPLFDDLVAEIRYQAEAAQVSVIAEAPPDVTLFADERGLRQILANFLSNGVKYSRPGSKVRLFARPGDGGTLLVGVEDHGIGMDEKGIRIALEPYSQLSNLTAIEGRGSGLGLPLARALIELHDARFQIESEPAVGTRVWSEFPADRVMTGAGKAA